MFLNPGRLTCVILFMLDGSSHSYSISGPADGEGVTLSYRAAGERRPTRIARNLSWVVATQYLLAIQELYELSADFHGYGQLADSNVERVQVTA